MFGHSKCEYCGNFGHTKDMKKHPDYPKYLYHPECFKKMLKRRSAVVCPCGKHVINKFAMEFALNRMGLPKMCTRVEYIKVPVPMAEPKIAKKKKAKKKGKKK